MNPREEICLLRFADKDSALAKRFDGEKYRGKNDCFIFQYTYSGMGIFEPQKDASVQYELPPRTAFAAILPSTCSYWAVDGADPWEFGFVSINLGKEEPLARHFIERHGNILSIDPDSALIEYLNSCIAIVQNRRIEIDSYTLSAMGYRFLMELYRHFGAREDIQQRPWVVTQAIVFMRNHLSESIGLSDICSKTGVSSTTLNRAFKRNAGTTVMRYMNRLRVEESKRLLLTTDSPVKAIAAKCGFFNDIHFCRVFREHEHTTPGNFRKEGML